MTGSPNWNSNSGGGSFPSPFTGIDRPTTAISDMRGRPGSTSSMGDSLPRPARPPFVWAAAAAVAGAVGLVLGALGSEGLIFAVIGWVIAGPIGIGLAGAYGLFNARAATQPWYGEPTWCRVLYWTSMVLVVVAVVVCALRIALFIGRM